MDEERKFNLSVDIKEKKKSGTVLMTEGSIWKKLLIFSVPLILGNLLQQLYSTVDSIIVGNCVGKEALAAVGATSALINLLVNVFMGLSIGTNVLTAQGYGARNEKGVQDTVHTSIMLSLVCGVLLIVIGVFLAAPLLELMGTPDNVLGHAALYMRIYFIGMPALLVYNFGAAILRAVGDTRRPLYYLLFSGIINVILNLIFVIIFKMGVAGVATATVVSETISAGLVLRCLMKSEGMFQLHMGKLRIKKQKALQIVRIGLPAGLQGAIFAISNVLIQSSINSFGSVAMAGNTAAGNLEGFVYTSMNAVYQTNLSFTSQNMGAGNWKRMKKILGICLVFVSVVGLVMGRGFVFFGHQLLGIYSSDPEVIQYGINRMQVICGTYLLCGIMDVLVGSMRYSFVPMIVSLVGACGLRILWIFTVFQWHRSLFVLYLSYPITWILTALAHTVCWYKIIHKRERQAAQMRG